MRLLLVVTPHLVVRLIKLPFRHFRDWHHEHFGGRALKPIEALDDIISPAQITADDALPFEFRLLGVIERMEVEPDQAELG